jgi:hypothetical protein
MFETLVFGINLLAIFAIWHFGIRRAVLAKCRDTLFELREDVRDHFIKNDISLAHPGYRQLRDMLNGYLLFTEKASLITFVFFARELRKDSSVAEIYKVRLEQRYCVFEPELKKFAIGVRKRAALTMQLYMMQSSVILTLVVLTMAAPLAIFFLLKKVLANLSHKLNRHSMRTIRASAGRAMQTSGVLIAGAVFAGTANAKNVVVNDVLEQCSIKYANACL